MAGIKRRIPEQTELELLYYLQEIRAHGDDYAWSHFDIMDMGLTIITLTGRLPEKGVLVGLAVYEYINPRQGAVRRGNENPGRSFKN